MKSRTKDYSLPALKRKGSDLYQTKRKIIRPDLATTNIPPHHPRFPMDQKSNEDASEVYTFNSNDVYTHLKDFVRTGRGADACLVNLNGFLDFKGFNDFNLKTPYTTLLHRDGKMDIRYLDSIRDVTFTIEPPIEALGKGGFGVINSHVVTKKTETDAGVRVKEFVVAIKRAVGRNSIATVANYDILDCGSIETIDFANMRDFTILPLIYGDIGTFVEKFKQYLEAQKLEKAEVYYNVVAMLMIIVDAITKQLICLARKKSHFLDVKPENIGFSCDGDGNLSFPLIDVDSIRHFDDIDIVLTTHLTMVDDNEQPPFEDDDEGVSNAIRCQNHQVGITILKLLNSLYPVPDVESYIDAMSYENKIYDREKQIKIMELVCTKLRRCRYSDVLLTVCRKLIVEKSEDIYTKTRAILEFAMKHYESPYHIAEL